MGNATGDEGDLRVDSLGGLCPVQGYGTMGGLPFYFRARHDGWSLEVADTPGGDPLASTEGHGLCLELEGDWGPPGGEAAGHIREAEAMAILRRGTAIRAGGERAGTDWTIPVSWDPGTGWEAWMPATPAPARGAPRGGDPPPGAPPPRVPHAARALRAADFATLMAALGGARDLLGEPAGADWPRRTHLLLDDVAWGQRLREMQGLRERLGPAGGPEDGQGGPGRGVGDT